MGVHNSWMVYVGKSIYKWFFLVGGDWNMAAIWLSIQLGRIIPTDFHIFRRGWNHQPVLYIYTLCIDIFWLNQDTGETIKTMGNWWLIVLYIYLLIFCCVKCLRTTSFAVDSVAFPSRSWRSCHVENSWAAKIVGPPKWRKIKIDIPSGYLT